MKNQHLARSPRKTSYPCISITTLLLCMVTISACQKAINPAPASKNETLNKNQYKVEINPEPLIATEPAAYPKDIEKYNWRSEHDPEFKVKMDGGTPQLYIIQGHKEYPVTPLIVLHKGTYLYHWGGVGTAETYGRLGFVTPQDLDIAINKSSSAVMVQGNGFYVSTLIWDTQSYGPKALFVIPEKDLLIASTDDVQKNVYVWPENIQDHEARKQKITSINRGLRAAGVHGVIQDYSQGLNGWLNIIHSDGLRHVASQNHPWISGTEEAFYKLIRNQELNETERAQMAPKLRDIFERTIGSQMCSYSLPFESGVAKIIQNFPNESEDAILAALGASSSRNAESHSDLNVTFECVQHTLQELGVSEEFQQKIAATVAIKSGTGKRAVASEKKRPIKPSK